jgi:hypothetical protein
MKRGVTIFNAYDLLGRPQFYRQSATEISGTILNARICRMALANGRIGCRRALSHRHGVSGVLFGSSGRVGLTYCTGRDKRHEDRQRTRIHS